MKHPVLKIKKNALIYDDKAQKQSPQAYPASTKIPVREHRTTRPRGRRAARLTFLPLLVLAIGLFLVMRVIPRSPADRATLAGWQVVLRATVAEETLIVGVTFIAEPKTIVPAAPPEAAVQVLIPDTGDRMTLSGALQRSPLTLRDQVPYKAWMKTVQAEVSLMDEHVTLHAAVR